jgi:hypothetical protein
MKKPTEPLRGEAAWKAAKKEVSDRNEAAYARGRRQRAARHAAWVARHQEDERQSNLDLRSRSGA